MAENGDAPFLIQLELGRFKFALLTAHATRTGSLKLGLDNEKIGRHTTEENDDTLRK
jgi:hypothetical protein